MGEKQEGKKKGEGRIQGILADHVECGSEES